VRSSLQKNFSCYETKQLILLTGTAIWWMTEPHYLHFVKKASVVNLLIFDDKYIDYNAIYAKCQCVQYQFYPVFCFSNFSVDQQNFNIPWTCTIKTFTTHGVAVIVHRNKVHGTISPHLKSLY